MATTAALIAGELQQIWGALDELDRKIGGDSKRAIIFDDDRADLIARINALEALRLVFTTEHTEEPGGLLTNDRLRARLVDGRAAALRAHAEWDKASYSARSNPDRKNYCEQQLQKIGRTIFVIEEGIAALRPETNDRDEALVSAVLMCDELLYHGVTDGNRAQVEMLARGLLEWHLASAAKSAEMVLGVR